MQLEAERVADTRPFAPGHARRPVRVVAAAIFAMLVAEIASAHGITGGDAAFVANSRGPAVIPFAYHGAKHMLAGVLGHVHANSHLVDAIITNHWNWEWQ